MAAHDRAWTLNALSNALALALLATKRGSSKLARANLIFAVASAAAGIALAVYESTQRVDTDVPEPAVRATRIAMGLSETLNTLPVAALSALLPWWASRR